MEYLPLLNSAISIFLFMCLVFVLALIIRNNSIVDIFWGIGFATNAVLMFVDSVEKTNIQLILTLAVCIWALRLSAHIFFRNLGKGEDPRYRKWREEWGKTVVWRSFLQVFMLQGAIMWLVLVPVTLAFCVPETKGFSLWLLPGVTVWLAGFLIESISDYQLTRFTKKAANKGQIMRNGIWAFSRHPNYFGEAVLWWGIWLISLSGIHSLLTLISPVLITFLLMRVSGVPMLEEMAKKKPGYKEWINETPAFFPRIFKTGKTN